MGADTLLVTLDTGLLDDRDRSRLDQLLASLPPDSDVVTVTVAGRERGIRGIVPEIPESGVWDVSLWDSGGSPFGGGTAWASVEDEHVFETALRIISNHSFPQPSMRGTLYPGQLNQLRDAMGFAAHVRDRRHLFLTIDVKGFVCHGNREQLESLGRTRIRTPDEVLEIASRPDASEVFAAMRR